MNYLILYSILTQVKEAYSMLILVVRQKDCTVERRQCTSYSMLSIY
jgi:hypothetical protein